MEQNVDTKSASRPLAAIAPFNPESQLFRRGIFSLFERRQIFNWSTKFVADGKFWKYIGFHLFPLRCLLVDNCVEQRSVNYKKIFGGFTATSPSASSLYFLVEFKVLYTSTLQLTRASIHPIHIQHLSATSIFDVLFSTSFFISFNMWGPIYTYECLGKN